ncbi:hypothetical protein [Caudoviricetes sp.]|nr:hypothetical protein [Caudoviricetes sp.]
MSAPTSTKNRTVAKTLTTSNSDIYVVPPRYSAYIDSLVIANVASTSVTFSLDWYDSATTAYHPIGGQVTMQPHSILQITDGFTLQHNDKFRGLASVATSITISVRVREDYSVTY